MTRILVISDTHIPARTNKIPEVLKKEAQTCDCCLHSGDFTTQPVFEKINSWVKTYGVRGNMDNDIVAGELPEKQILKFEDITIGLIHGSGHPNNLIEYINKEFAREFDKIDIFVFGHSHNTLDKEIKGKIYFNPGSPTDTVFAPYRSYGILEINGKNIKRKIMKIT